MLNEMAKKPGNIAYLVHETTKHNRKDAVYVGPKQHQLMYECRAIPLR